MPKHGKRFLAWREKIDREREYEPGEAVSLLKAGEPAKFDESVELHVRTGLNVRHADEQLRGTIALPHGLGKNVSIAVFAQGDKAREAEEAGADVVGAEDLAKRVEEGYTDFDVAIATPDLMPVVGKLGRVLGPQGKMPNPKVGTVTMDVSKAVEESKAGKVEYRTDRTAIVHMVIGKSDFEARRLLENYQAVIEEIAAQIKESQAVFAVDYRGISVPEAAELRARLRDADAVFRVVKNSLTERAADKAGAEQLKELLEGPTAFTFVHGDAALAAKAVSDFARRIDALAFKGGIMNGEPLAVEQLAALARLPSREVLYAQLVGTVAAPVTGLVRGLNALIAGLAIQLQQIAEQGLVTGEAPAPAEEAEEAPAEAAEPEP